MEKQSKIRSLPFLTALVTAQNLYGLQMVEDDFIEIAYPVWRDIGNIAPILERLFIKIPDDGVIELPSSCEFIESITLVDGVNSYYSFDSGGNKDRQLPSVVTRSNIPSVNQSLQNTPGLSVNYVLEPGVVRVTSVDMYGREVMVVFRSILSDDNGLPFLNDKEVAAIAAEVTRRDTIRQSFQGVAAKKAMMEYIIGEANRLMQAAKIDESISDDAFDKLLDIKTSWDRKVYNRRKNLM